MRDTNLVNALREHADWARANEWETPITLSDDLAEAADRIEAQAKEIEKLRGQVPHWIPVRVSYSFCARGPVWKLLMVYALPS